MTFVSYAQNFEDVLLWRALCRLPTGFYIDVGAAHPDTDSVTRAFYDRGWHGLNIEPTPAGYLRLQAARPRDVNLQLALGAAPGQATFFAVEGADAGLSTLDAAAASRYADLGRLSQTLPVRVDTLAAVCRQHVHGAIHFLKIDVEGGERDVLQGADFTKFRPWIVLVEATAPMSTTQVHAEWETILLQAAYGFVWFDGLNRFYVADEHRALLAPAFQVPVNVFDDFLRAADTEWTRRMVQAETRSAALQPRVDTSERRAAIAEDRAEAAHLRLAQDTAEAARMRARAEQLQGAVEHLQHVVAVRTAEADAARRRAEQAEQAHGAAAGLLEATRHSTSWRVTKPLRALGGLRARGAPPPDTQAVEAPIPPGVPTVPAAPPAPRRGAPVTAVHQFHSGSAVGDAVTNAMVLTRELLRGLGYDSRIFVERRGDGCGDDLHLIEDLPLHDRYALIVRHSMGHDALGRILALPVPKLLIYHNITPPALLQDSPFMQDYARKGRRQLAELRPAVAAALADSEYNALELRQAGFGQVAACPLLFDVDAMLRRAAPAARGAVFTILFVGRFTRSKGQRELVAAYARFRAMYRGESRLVLVGGGGDLSDPYVAETYHLIRKHKLDTGAVEITGHVGDEDLRRRYAEADLYVSLSRHEGFGVPLIEAMANGVPVLAYRAGAVPSTLGGTSPLLEDTTPEGVATRMLDLARDPAARAAIVERQSQALPRFRLDRHVPALLAALGCAGVRIPPDAAARAALATGMRFTVAGHVSGTYSLAEVNRALAVAIEAGAPGAVRLVAVEGGITTQVSGIPPEQRDTVRALLSRPAPDSGPHVAISQHYPLWAPPEPADLVLSLFFWEESLVQAATVEALNAGFGGVLAPSRFVAKALIDSGVEIPVRVLGQAPQLERFRRLRAERAAPGSVFTFLHVSSAFPRKGIDVLLAAYAQAFRRSDRVRLVIKSFPNPHNEVAAQLARLREGDPGAPEIQLFDEDMEEAELLALYREADVMVLPSRGEGYNLPAAEALAAGLGLIVTGYGGHMDFVAGMGAVRLLAYRMAPSASHLASAGSLWAEPDVDDLVLALREAAEHGRPADMPDMPRETGLVDRLRGIAADLLLAPPRAEVSVAWITTWGVRCGVAGYAEQLVRASPGVATVLADHRSAPAEGPIRVIPAWRPLDPASIPELAGSVLRLDPRVVAIQHQPGLLSWGTLAALLETPALSGRVVCVALHNTRHLLDVADTERQAALRALAAASRVVVHTLHDLDRLARLGLADNVTMIAHGAPVPRPAAAPRVLAPEDAVLIGCYGFFLPGKGLPELIAALAILRRRWTRMRLVLVNAEYPHPDSAAEIASCRAAVAASGLTDAVEFVTAFLKEGEAAARLAACDLVVLPYQASKEASSAALRSALAAGVPVAVTPLPLFDEAEDAVIRLPGTGAEVLALGIEGALLDRDARSASAAAAGTWLQERTWSEIARRWDRLFRGLSASDVVTGA